jgi:hypothetical protein
MSEDRDFRALFEDLRGEVEEQAPPFGKVWLAARQRLEHHAAGGSRRWLLPTAVALSAAVVLVVVLVSAPGLREPTPPFEIEAQALAISEWEAPLDFLLEAPESEMFSPEIWPSAEGPSNLPTLTDKEIL